MTWTSFDEYMNEQFKKKCPGAAKFLNSINPIAKKAAESLCEGRVALVRLAKYQWRSNVPSKQKEGTS